MSRARLRRAALLERRQVLEEEDRQRIHRVREPRRAPPELAPGGRPAPALDGVAHLDAAAPHREHVGGQIVALNDDVAEAAAPREEIEEPSVEAARRGRGPRLLRPVVHAQKLEIVLPVEGDRIVRPLARMHAAGRHREADAPEGGDPLVQVRHADHHVVDARQHGSGLLRVIRSAGRGRGLARIPRGYRETSEPVKPPATCPSRRAGARAMGPRRRSSTRSGTTSSAIPRCGAGIHWPDRRRSGLCASTAIRADRQAGARARDPGA